MSEKKFTPHVHAEVIKAWADGKPIQLLDDAANKWHITPAPQWHVDFKYRVKPEEVVEYTLVLSQGYVAARWWSTKREVADDYAMSYNTAQGFCKRTTVEGKVVSLEFIPI